MRAALLAVIAIGCGDDAAVAADAAPIDAPQLDANVDAAPTYDDIVIADRPVAFWPLHGVASEIDLSGHGHAGSYPAGVPAAATMPNGDPAIDFDGVRQYFSAPSAASFSIPTTGELTWEGWIRPDVLQFAQSPGGYVDWMGKCESYAPSCEWEARMYDLTSAANRPSRLSAYVFNPSAGLGSGADWQPAAGVIQAGHWYYVVGQYQTRTQPAGCNGPEVGGIDIWVQGVEWDQAVHLQTGCLSQYHVTPVAGASPLDVGTMAKDTWFAGAVGKVAIYDRLLTPAQIARHFTTMTGLTASGSCADTCTAP